jgi:hypothetical protein
MGAITLDLRPGLGVGPFTLGENPNHLPPPRQESAVAGCFLAFLSFCKEGKTLKKTCFLSKSFVKFFNFEPILT